MTLRVAGALRTILTSVLVISIVVWPATLLPPANAQAKVDALTLNTGEDNLRSAVIDTANGYAYLGTYTSPGRIVKIRLSDFTRVGAITLLPGQNYVASGVICATCGPGGHAYFGTDTSPGYVVDVDLSTFSVVDSITLPAGDNFLASAVIDTGSSYAYFGTNTAPGRVVKVPIASLFGDPVETLALTMDPAKDKYLVSAVIDTASGYAYFGTTTGKIEWVQLSPFRHAGATSLDAGETDIYSAVMAHGYAYFGTYSTVAKFDIYTRNKVAALNLYGPLGPGYAYAAAIDMENRYAYFAWGTRRVLKIDLQTFSWVGAIDWFLSETEGSPCSAVFDAANGYAYFGTDATPGRVVKIAPSPLTVVRGMDNGIYFGSHGGKEWNRLPGATKDSPAAVRCAGGLHVAVRGMNDGIYYGYFDFSTKSFSGWVQVPGKTSSAPALTTNQYCSVLYLVVRGMNNGVYVNTRASGNWGGWIKLPGATVDGPAAEYGVGGSPSILHIVVRGMDGSSIYHGQVPVVGGSIMGFYGWSKMSGGTPSKPALAAISEWEIYLAVRGLDNLVYTNKWNGFAWKGWIKVPTATTTADAPSLAISGDLYVAVRGTNNGIYWCGISDYSNYNSYSCYWYGWNRLRGSTPSSPSLAS